MRWNGVVVVLVLVRSSTPCLAQERITVEQAVEAALRQNLPLLAARQRARASHEMALATGARLLPSVRLSDELQHWDCPAGFLLQRFSGGAQCVSALAGVQPRAPDLSAFTPAQRGQLESLIAAFSGPPVVLRDQSTNTFSAGVSQPLFGLPHLGFELAAARANAKASDAGVKVAEAAVRQGVRTGFLRLFEARAREEIAAASVAELEQQVRQARVRLEAHVITTADLLRVQVAAANARQQQIAAGTEAAIIKANLLDAIGLSPSAPVELVEPRTLLAAAAQPLPELGEATRLAQRHRPEVAQAALAESAAAHGRRSRYLAMLPEVNGEAAYLRTDGQLFAPPDQWFIGVRASWAIWEWGATFFMARAAARQSEAAVFEVENQRRAVRLEVQNALARMRAARVSVEVAKQAIGSAQEAYRVTLAAVRLGTATTTDLLDAQAALTTARLNLARAEYELAIQRVALVRAMGE